MFRRATEIAQKFTLPVVLSRRTVGDKCSSSIAAFVVVNSDGWIVTANHVFETLMKLNQETKQTKDTILQRDQIESAGLKKREKKQQLAKVKKPNNNATLNFSVWWGKDGVELTFAVGNSAVDFGLGRLEPFDPAWVTSYPVFKDPTKNFKVGTSLCKLGFPFHQIEPIWDAAKGIFELPSGALPLPFFPIDGIFTRTVEIVVQGGPQPRYPLSWVETSTPGLKGQSGGPTYDVEGVVWGLQCQTMHFPLGFDPEAPGQRGRKEYQFLNVGVGVHPDTMFGMFKEHGVRFEVSNY